MKWFEVKNGNRICFGASLKGERMRRMFDDFIGYGIGGGMSVD
jgi:hypothetical protein